MAPVCTTKKARSIAASRRKSRHSTFQKQNPTAKPGAVQKLRDFAIRQKRLGAHAQKRRSRPLGTRPPGYNAPMALMGIRDLSCSLCEKSVEVPSREREQNSHCESHRKTCLQGLFMTEHQEFLQNSPSALIRLGPNEKRRQTERIYQLEAFDNLTQINTTIRAQLHSLAYFHPEYTPCKL